MNVLFYGQYIPLHGIPVIIEAARLLRDLPIAWTLIGRGQESQLVDRMIAAEPLPGLTRIPWVDYPGLGQHLAEADLCLGIFGTSDKAASVIPNKVFQLVCAGRPLITRDSPAIRELFPLPGDCIRLVEAGSASALADAIRAYYEAGQWAFAVRCHADLAKQVDPPAIGRQFLAYLTSRLGRGTPP
jgi:glycosyltransferase involved in cell wall biosynthesis